MNATIAAPTARPRLALSPYLRNTIRMFEGSYAPAGPLADLKVLDLTEELGAYAGRLLGDLGAEVVRLESSGGSRHRSAGHVVAPGLSADYVFPNLSKTVVEVDIESPPGRTVLEHLLATSDIVITGHGPSELKCRDLHPDQLSRRHPHLVHLSISPWGLTGPDCDRPATDLTLLAAGGLLALAGDPDGPPVRPFGNQSSVTASLHGVVGALIALCDLHDGHGDRGVDGQLVDVSAQEAVAHSLENAVQFYDLEGVVRRRAGSRGSEAGSGLFACKDGHIYLVTGIGGFPLAWGGLVTWLREAGATAIARELEQPRWSDQQWRRTQPAVREFRAMFERFAGERTKVDLYERGQAHGVSVSPVSTPEDLLSNPQLQARDFYKHVDVGGSTLVAPGAPYRLSGYEVGPRPLRTYAGMTDAG